MSIADRNVLHDLVDALPPEELQAAQRHLELLLAMSDPLAGLPDDERARLHGSLQEAEGEFAADEADQVSTAPEEWGWLDHDPAARSPTTSRPVDL